MLADVRSAALGIDGVAGSRAPGKPEGLRRRAVYVMVAALAVLFAAPSPAPAAQEAAVVEGTVLSTDGDALGDVEVRVVDSYRGTRTRADGRFRLRLSAGEWRLRFRRPGFRSATRAVHVPGTGDVPALEVRLQPEPVQLRGISAPAEPRRPFERTITRETARQVPALAEPDLFRSAVFLPGVSQPNDLRGRLHLAGGASDETGVTLDGHPLQDPFHLLGLLGAFNVAALERAEVRLHGLPPSAGGHLSGVIGMETRRPEREGEWEGVLSLLSGSLTTVQPDVADDLHVLASGRVTWVDRVVELIDAELPRLGYRDGLLKVGWTPGDAWRVEALGFVTDNSLRGGAVRELRPREPLEWGERMAGVRVERSTGAWRARLRASADRATTSFDERPAGDRTIDVRRDLLTAELEVERRADGWRAVAGAEIEHRDHDQGWRNFSRDVEVISPGAPASFRRVEDLTAGALYGELSVRLADPVRATAGVRLLRHGGAWRPAPRLSVSYRPGERWSISASAERRHQWTAQPEEPIEGSVPPPLFLLDEPREADVLALEGRWTPGADGGPGAPELRAVAFLKRYRRQTFLMDLPDRVPPLAGGARDPDAPPYPAFLRPEGRAFGGHLSARIPLGGEGILQAGYTFQRSRVEVEGERFRRGFDVPHTLELFGALPLGGGWQATAGLRLHSGPPATPVRAVGLQSRLPPGRTLGPRIVFGKWNSARLRPYVRLDAGVRHSWSWTGARWTFFGQVLNATSSENAQEPDLGRLLFDQRPGDNREGLPLLPTLGVEVRW